MSAIRDRISDEMKTAMKSKDKERLGTLRLLKAEIMKFETAGGASDIDEAGLIQLIRTMIKQRNDSIAQYEKGGRPELAENEAREIAVLETFLPKQLSDEELETIVADVISELGITDMKGMGNAVKEVLARAQGGADGKRVSTAVRTRLS